MSCNQYGNWAKFRGGRIFPIISMSISDYTASSCSSKRQLEKDLEAVREAGKVSGFRISCSVLLQYC